jgi:CRISPR-associated protein Cas1
LFHESFKKIGEDWKGLFMETLYTIEPGSYLKKDGQSLKVVKSGHIIDQIPAGRLKKLVLCGYVSLTGGVLDFLIKNRVETVFITPTGRFRARLMIDEHKHVALRQQQYLRLSDSAESRKFMCQIVAGKIANMARFLREHSSRYNNENLAGAAARLKVFGSRLDTGMDAEVIRGMEGAATRIYFSVFAHLIRNPGFSFDGRNRRPPLDPVNALLSFIYTMLTNEVLSAIKICGLDPYLGSLHEVAYGRPSLACDLVEEFRCHLGDRFVLSLINRKMVRPDDFVFRKPSGNGQNYADEKEMRENRPVEMKPETCRSFIAAYEAMMNRTFNYPRSGGKLTYRRLILYQVRRFAESLADPDAGYEPFLPEK